MNNIISQKGKIDLSSLYSYEYPRVVLDHLESIFTIVVNTLKSENIYSIILIGSTARGELTYKLEGLEIDIFSDYEFVIVAKKGVSFPQEEVLKLKKRFEVYGASLNIKSPLFDIDFGIVSFQKFKLTPNTLWSFEVKKCGVVVFGEDGRELLKTTTIENLDFGNLNELIIVRLWNMLLHTPENIIRESASDYERFITKFYYCRNILDILTIYFPSKNILIETYKNRLNLFEKDTSITWKPLKKDIVNAHAFKLNLIDNISYREAQNGFFDGFMALINGLQTKQEGFEKINDINQLNLFLNNFKKTKIFNEKPIRYLRRKFMESKLFIKFIKERKPLLNTLRWGSSDLRPSLFMFLAYMHYALINKSECEEAIKLALVQYNTFANENLEYNKQKNPIENFIDIRSHALNFMVDWFYGRTNVNINDLLEITKWKES